MKIVVDTNILFSALLNSEGKIGHLLFNSSNIFEFYSVNFLKKEIEKHQEKLILISGLKIDALKERSTLVYDQIKFINEQLLPEGLIISAEDLVQNIDPDDTLHIALAEHLKAKLWTGDKRLINGLKSKGYKNFIDTNSLWNIRARRMTT